MLAGELLVERPERVAELHRGANGAECVVLTHGRDPEHGHHRIPDELLDRATVPLEHALHDVEVPPHHAAEELGIEPVAERGRVGDVSEEDGDHLPRLVSHDRAPDGRAAARAEPRVWVILSAARGAGHDGEPTGRSFEMGLTSPDYR